MKVWVKQADENKTVIALEGKMTSETIQDTDNAFQDILSRYPGRRIVLDFTDVQYISSAGLRCLAKLRTALDESFEVIEVNNDVYDVFEMTGFNQLLTVRRKIKEISVEGCEIVGRGANSIVYRVDRDTIVKVYTPGMPIGIPERECAMAQHAFLDGIPTALTYRRIVRCGESYGVMFELIDSNPLTVQIQSDPENFETYMKQYVELLRELNSKEADTKFYPSIKQLYRDYVLQSREWYTEEELEKLLYFVDNIPDRTTLVHGDYHVKNIMVSEGKLVLIDMGDMAYGHPVFDHMAMTAVLYNLLNLDPAFAESYNGVPCDVLWKIWNRSVELYFGVKGEEEIKRISEKLSRITTLRNGIVPAITSNLSREKLQYNVDTCKANLIPHIEEALEDIRTLL